MVHFFMGMRIMTIDNGDDADKYGNDGEGGKDDGGYDDCDMITMGMKIFSRWVDDDDDA